MKDAILAIIVQAVNHAYQAIYYNQEFVISVIILLKAVKYALLLQYAHNAKKDIYSQDQHAIHVPHLYQVAFTVIAQMYAQAA
jgi:hypothetical protein